MCTNYRISKSKIWSIKQDILCFLPQKYHSNLSSITNKNLCYNLDNKDEDICFQGCSLTMGQGLPHFLAQTKAKVGLGHQLFASDKGKSKNELPNFQN